MPTQSEYCVSMAQRKEKDKEMRKMKGYIPSRITKIELFIAGVVALKGWGVGGGILKFILKLWALHCLFVAVFLQTQPPQFAFSNTLTVRTSPRRIVFRWDFKQFATVYARYLLGLLWRIRNAIWAITLCSVLVSSRQDVALLTSDEITADIPQIFIPKLSEIWDG